MTSEPARPERVVLDTNVLASALAFGGLPETMLELGRAGEIEIFVSPFILGELSRVLASRKFRWEAGRIGEAISDLRSFMKMVEPRAGVRAISAHDEDNRILECGLEAKAAAIVTGNMRHIRPLGMFEGIEILTPREFLDRRFPWA